MAVVEITSTSIPTIASDDRLVAKESSGAVVTNVNKNTIDLQRFDIPSTFFNDIGTESSPFFVDVSNTTTITDPTVLNRSRAGTLYLKSSTNGIDNYQHHGTGNMVFVDGVIVRLGMTSGVVKIADAADVTSVYIGGGSFVMLDNASTDPTLIEVYGGQAQLWRGATKLVNSGGNTLIDAGTNTFGTVEVNAGATVVWRDSGTITSMTIRQGGVVRLDDIRGTLTITTLTGSASDNVVRSILNNGNITVGTFVNTVDYDA